jgi:predicted Rossmann fold flavoprotein
MSAAISASMANPDMRIPARGQRSRESGERGAFLHITVFDQHVRVGKKLARTGNGRCNIMNVGDISGAYRGDAAFAQHVIRSADTGAFLRSIGLVLAEENGGRIYPASKRAGGVIDALRFQLEGRGVEVRLEVVESVVRNDDSFVINNSHKADKVIIATGGKAGILPCDATGYSFLSGFGHAITRLAPALTHVNVQPMCITGLKGVRLDCEASLLRKDMVIYKEEGEIIFGDSSISGIPVMNLSRLVEDEDTLAIDMFPRHTAEELTSVMQSAFEYVPDIEKVLCGLIHPRIAKIVHPPSLKNWRIPIMPNKHDFTRAQVTAGGVSCAEFSPDTMESRRVRGLYAAGEVLDVDGICGGFNLMFAFASGILAGRNAGRHE